MRRRPLAIVAAAITVYDLWLIRRGQPTISADFARLARHPVMRVPTIGAWIYLSVHLLELIPEHRDPLRRLATTLTPTGRNRAWG